MTSQSSCGEDTFESRKSELGEGPGRAWSDYVLVFLLTEANKVKVFLPMITGPDTDSWGSDGHVFCPEPIANSKFHALLLAEPRSS
jgi:hypothetical protein